MVGRCEIAPQKAHMASHGALGRGVGQSLEGELLKPAVKA